MAAPPFRRMAGRGFFSLRCSLLVAHAHCNLLCRRLSQHDQVPCYISLKHSAVVHTTLSCYFHTVIWLGKCQSLLTQTQHSSELDTVCYRTSTFGSMTCSQVGAMSLGWPLAPSGGLVQSCHSLSQEEANVERPGNAHSKCSETIWPEIHVPIFRISCFFTTLQGKEAHLSYTTCQE